MTDPPEFDGEVPERFLELIDEILADESFQAPPSTLAERRARSGRPKRFIVYGAVAAAALALAIVGVSALQDSNIPSVDTERAATPISPATSDAGVAGEGGEAQIAADAQIAAEFGLTLGPRVFRDDLSFELADQPDLTPVYDDDELVGYAHRRDIDPDMESKRFVVYGPDGTTVRGAFDPGTGFVATADPSAEEGD